MRIAGLLCGLGIAAVLASPGRAGVQQATPEPASATAPLFAAIFRTGPKWDAARPPQEQAFFKEHSANLMRLRKEGAIRLGARYGDVGLIVVAAADEEAARRLFQDDPSVAAGTFQLDVHAFNAFFKGCVN